jgi:lysophospholipase L1-like esterase
VLGAGIAAFAPVPLRSDLSWPDATQADEIIEAQGDSLTYGRGASGTGPGKGPYPLQLQRRLVARYGRKIQVHNQGVGGVNARVCGARANAPPAHFSVAGEVLPQSGPAIITWFDAQPITGQAPAPLAGTLAGVRGTLSVPRFNAGGQPEAMIFTRTVPGPTVPVAPHSAFLSDLGADSRGNMKLMVYGRNGQKAADIFTAVDADIAYQNRDRKRWAVGSVLTAVTEAGTPKQAEIRALNTAIAQRYGANYVDLDSPPTPEEAATLGWSPDAAGPYYHGHSDRADTAAGVIPTGMRLGGTDDNQHLNNYGYALWALRFDRHILRQGWFGPARGANG